MAVEFSQNINLGEILLGAGLVGSAVWNYFTTIRRIDALEQRQDGSDSKIEDLRRGRGLILGQDSDWPDAVRRCFGFGSSNGRVP